MLQCPDAQISARLRHGAGLALSLALVAPASLGCSHNTLVEDAAQTYDTAPFDGPGFVDGHLQAHAIFPTVGRVLWFDDPGDSSIHIYVFEDMPTCDDVSKVNWLTSSNVRPANVLGITVGGEKPGVYRIALQKPPRAENAYLLQVIDQTDPVIESEGVSGTVTITGVKPGNSVSGAFDATFSTGTLRGAFNAVSCPTGIDL
jgi:hypothetical protein